MYRFSVKHKEIKTLTFFLLYYELPEGVFYKHFSASSNDEFEQNLKSEIENLSSDLLYFELFEELDFDFDEISRTINVSIVPV